MKPFVYGSVNFKKWEKKHVEHKKVQTACISTCKVYPEHARIIPEATSYIILCSCGDVAFLLVEPNR